MAPAGVDDRAVATLSLHTKYYSAECRIVSLPLPLPVEVEADAAAWFEANAPDCQAVIAVFDLADVCAAAIECLCELARAFEIDAFSWHFCD